MIDEETRRYLASQRLAALEMDNYEEPSLAALSADGAYVDDEEEEEVAQGGRSRKRKSRSGATGGGGGGASGGASAKSSKSASGAYRVRNFEHVVAEEEYDSDSINYRTIAAGPSDKPARHLCSVCGYAGSYSCPRCGLRFCGLRCQHTHKETRCLK